MKRLTDTLVTIAVLGGILVLSALFTNWFTRKMYFTCGNCRALNAKRRTHCRICGDQLTLDKEQPSEKAE
jgi:ribosomal protein L40E